MPALHELSPTPGWIASERTPTSDELYVSVAELADKYCFTADEGEIRYAMDLINSYVNRPSLWPEIYEERIELPDDRNTCIVSARPVTQLLFCAGRYGGGRRDQRTLLQTNFDYLAALAVLGSAPRWQEIDVDQIELYPASGELWLPTGYFPIRYAQVQVRYETGLSQIPSRVKGAIAGIINTIRNRGVGSRTTHAIGQVRQVYQGVGFLGPDERMMLEPYVVRALG